MKTAKESSGYVNGWFGQYAQLTMGRTFTAELFDLDLDAVSDQAVSVGDSPDDQLMFAFFRNSVGVANGRDFRGRQRPARVALSRAVDGIGELTDALMETRGPWNPAGGNSSASENDDRETTAGDRNGESTFSLPPGPCAAEYIGF